MDTNSAYRLWKEKAGLDPDLIRELDSIANDAEGVADRFYTDLAFGTAGLRGVIGAGTNRMNIYTVGRATQGMANYVNGKYGGGSVAIAYDSRVKSREFAESAAGVFAANGIKVHIYSELMPTPMLSFAVRELCCQAGIIITASHNPSKYNGYKAYGSDGCQLNLEDSRQVMDYIEQIDIFKDVKRTDFSAGIKDGTISYITGEVIEKYIAQVKKQAIHPMICRRSNLQVIYTPLHGAGNKPVRRIFDEMGLAGVTVVPSQEQPDGNFPTAPYPNPEIRGSFEEAIKLSRTVKADLLLATDPDCDRVGIAVFDGKKYELMTGNQVGALLLNYILSQRSEMGNLPKDPVTVKTIVTTDLIEYIAEKYRCQVVEVLTGFKFIGEQIGLLEAKGEEERYIFGFEESYGYLAGAYVRDKDAVVGSMLICEMAAFYKEQGKNLLQALEDIHDEFGAFYDTLLNVQCEGISGMERITELMSNFRSDPPATIGGLGVLTRSDYQASESINTRTGEKSVITLPKSDVLSYKLENGNSVIVRPSGTEPKIKVYVSARGETMDDAKETANQIMGDMNKRM